MTGELTPDVTGLYHDAGLYNSRPSFELEGDGWFIWWDGIETWIISPGRGFFGDTYWTHPFLDIEGVYVPEGLAVGGATVTVV